MSNEEEFNEYEHGLHEMELAGEFDVTTDNKYIEHLKNLSPAEYKKSYEGDWSQAEHESRCSNCDGLGEVLYIGRWVLCANCEGKGFIEIRS